MRRKDTPTPSPGEMSAALYGGDTPGPDPYNSVSSGRENDTGPRPGYIRVRVLERFAPPWIPERFPAPHVGDIVDIPADTDWITLGLCEPVDAASVLTRGGSR
jgi:hypothetical protein